MIANIGLIVSLLVLAPTHGDIKGEWRKVQLGEGPACHLAGKDGYVFELREGPFVWSERKKMLVPDRGHGFKSVVRRVDCAPYW